MDVVLCCFGGVIIIRMCRPIAGTILGNTIHSPLGLLSQRIYLHNSCALVFSTLGQISVWLQHGARVIAVRTHTRTPPHDPSELHGYFLKCSSFLLARMLSALNVATHALVKVLKEVAAKFGVKLKLTRDNTCPM